MNNMDKGWPLHEVKPEKNTDGFPLGKEPTLEELLEKTNNKLGINPEKGIDWEINNDSFIYLSIEDGVPVVVIEDLKTGKVLENRIENDSDIDEMLAAEGVPDAMIAKANENKPEVIAV